MITQWSFSRYKTYKQCPRKIKYQYIDGLKSPGSPATDRGQTLHKAGEMYLNHELDELPQEFTGFNERMAKLREIRAYAEEQWSFTDNWAVTTWRAPDAWCRMGIDVNFRFTTGKMAIIDFKSGRIYDDSKEQMSLYALGAFLRDDELQEVKTELWYLDQKETLGCDYSRNQLETLRDTWQRNVHHLLNDTIFPARPGPLCKYCHFRKANFGPCEY